MSFRIEEKLMVGSRQLAGLHTWLALEGASLLHPKRRIHSTYFDTPDYALFTDSEEGNIPRKKIRIRSYNSRDHQQGDNALEVKISSVEGRYKTTNPLDRAGADEMISMGYYDPDYGVCEPVVSVSYDREYYAVADVRLTIDTDIEYLAHRSCFAVRDSSIAVEIKAPSDASMDALAKAIPFRRTRFSKYARSIEATRKGSAAWL
jgi:hypothetical protein